MYLRNMSHSGVNLKLFQIQDKINYLELFYDFMIEIISKLIAESLLSLYPIFVKKISLPVDIQLWSRLLSYAAVSILFTNITFIKNQMFSTMGILLSIITVIHVYTSYKGFEVLESGISYTLFYMYPLMILLLAGYNFQPIMLLTIVGFLLLTYTGEYSKTNHSFGIIMILLAALTEALIYFIVKNIPTDNPWNHLFLSYGIGAILLTMYYYKKIPSLTGTFRISIIVNAIIGLIGYYLRFYSMSNLGAQTYALLSYFGIIMSHIYGIIFNNEKITIFKIIGTFLIIISSYKMSSQKM